MSTIHPNYLDALEVVLTWNIPDDVLPMAVSEQAKLMSGFECERTYMEDITP